MQTQQQKIQQISSLLKSLPYQNKSVVEAQLKQLVLQINSLRPKVEDYHWDNGVTERLFKLEGTIPITYSGRQYNIPVAYWLPIQFPGIAPRCYVTPVRGMKIKPRHLHVDPSGFVYHPYLNQWKNNTSNLVELTGMLCSVFGKDPPVFAENPAQAQRQQYQARPPQGGPQSMYGGGQQPQSMYGGQPQQPKPNVYGGGPAAQSMYGGQPQQPYRAQQQPQPQPMQQWGMQPQPNAVNNMAAQRPSQPQPMANQMNVGSNVGGNRGMSVTSADTKQNVERKLRAVLESLYEKENSEMKQLSEKQSKLEKHKREMESIEKQIVNEKQLLTDRRLDLESKIQFLEKWLAVNEKSDEFDVSAVVSPSDTWSNQCMEAVAHDVALTDLMLELDRALEDESIKLDQYLKQLRKLAREQFMKRALAQAVHRKQDMAIKANANPSQF